MTLLRSVRDALVTSLTPIQGLRAVALVPDQINPPVAIVYRKQIDYDIVFGRGGDQYTFGITIYGGAVSERTTQDLLDSYCLPSGATSVKTAVELDNTLGGVVDYVRVLKVSETTPVTAGGVDYLVVDFELEVVV
jgi:hypothetical protein